MVIVHQRATALVMAGPSSRIGTIKRESIIARPSLAPQRTRWQCSICGKLLSSKRSYDEHLNIHNQARPFTCDHCDYAAASQMTLRRHILRNHTSRDDWHYKCPYCGETYMEPASYQQHVSSRHFGRSATFGCPFPACTFQTKCSKHFREHLVKHHSCTTNSRRNIGQEEDGAGSSSHPILPTNPLSLTDENLQQYLVNDDLGAGFGRRLTSITRPIIRSNGEIANVIAVAAAERSTNGGNNNQEVGSNMVPVHQISSSIVSSIPSRNPPIKRMIVVRKTERNDDEMPILPSTSSSFTSFPSSSSSSISSIPRLLPSSRDDLHHIPITDDDFMKAPITLHRSTVPPPPPTRMAKVQLAPMGRRTHQLPSSSTSSLMMNRRIKIEEGVQGVQGGTGRSSTNPSRRPPSPITLGGSRHAPAMISADGGIWMIEHEEEIDETKRDVHIYDNGCMDVDVD